MVVCVPSLSSMLECGFESRLGLEVSGFSVWQSPHCAANCLQHVRSSGQGAVVCKSRATHRALITCNMPCAT